MKEDPEHWTPKIEDLVINNDTALYNPYFGIIYGDIDSPMNAYSLLGLSFGKPLASQQVDEACRQALEKTDNEGDRQRILFSRWILAHKERKAYYDDALRYNSHAFHAVADVNPVDEMRRQVEISGEGGLRELQKALIRDAVYTPENEQHRLALSREVTKTERALAKANAAPQRKQAEAEHHKARKQWERLEQFISWAFEPPIGKPSLESPVAQEAEQPSATKPVSTLPPPPSKRKIPLPPPPPLRTKPPGDDIGRVSESASLTDSEQAKGAGDPPTH